MPCDGQAGDLTCLVVIQGPGAQPLSIEAPALHVVINVSGASPLLLYLSECEKDGITQPQPSPQLRLSWGRRPGHRAQEGLILAAQLSPQRQMLKAAHNCKELRAPYKASTALAHTSRWMAPLQVNHEHTHCWAASCHAQGRKDSIIHAAEQNDAVHGCNPALRERCPGLPS